MSKFLFIVFFYTIATKLLSQDLRFEHITAEDGLSQSSALCMTQDSIGFMWFGTPNGLNRYDGYTIKIYRHDDNNIYSISENFILSLLNDSRNILWIGTLNGLNIYDHKTERFYTIDLKSGNATVNSIRINAIFESMDGSIWIGTWGQGLIKITVPNELNDLLDKLEIYHFNNDPEYNNPFTSNNISDINQNRNGNLWITTRNGITVFDPRKEKVIKTYHSEPNNSQSLSNNNTTEIDIDSENNIWIATWGGGLNKYNPDTDCFIRFINDPANSHTISNNYIKTLMSDSLGKLWIGTWGGGLNLLHYQKNISNFIRFSHNPGNVRSINGDYINDIYQDNTGVFWIGLDWKGLSKYDPDSEKFKYFNLQDETNLNLNSNIISAILKDSKGILWIGTQGDGLINFDRKTRNAKQYLNNPENKNSISNNAVRAIFEDKNGNLWIGTELGLNLFNRRTEMFKTYFINQIDFGNKVISNIFEDSDGMLWIACRVNGLYMYNPKTNRLKIFKNNPSDPHSLADNMVWSVNEGVDGSLWIGTDNGLCLFDKMNQTFKSFKSEKNNPKSLSDSRILSITVSYNGDLLVGTSNGLNILNGRADLSKSLEFKRITKKEGMPENPVRGIMEDKNGNLWLSNGTMLTKINKRNGEIEGYSGFKVLKIGELKINSNFKDKQTGHMYFGGINGFVYFHPDSIFKNKFKPSIAVTDIKIHNKSVSAGDTLRSGYIFQKSVTHIKNIKLSYKENNIAFDITALHFNEPRNNQFTFRLQPVEDDWHVLQGYNRTASYYNLGPGKYTFQYSASNNNGVWNKEGDYLNINITPPFWLSLWFKITIAIIIVVLIIYIYRLRIRRIIIYNKELEDNVKMRTQQLEASNKELEAFAYSVSHDLRAPLRGINGYAKVIEEDYQNELGDDVKKYFNKMVNASSRMGSLIDSILKLSRIIRSDMKKETVNLSKLASDVIDELKVANPEREVDVEIQPNMYEHVDAGLIRIVLDNLIQNAWKFTENKTKTKIDIGYSLVNGQKEYYVRDNGVGFDMKYADKLFIPFNRLHSDKEFEGMGIGLASVKKIIDKHGGKICAESKINEGTIFSFTL